MEVSNEGPLTGAPLFHSGKVASRSETCVREYLSTGYGLLFSTESYGSKRENTFSTNYPEEACFVTEIFEHRRKPPGVYGMMYLGILYSSCLLL